MILTWLKGFEVFCAFGALCSWWELIWLFTATLEILSTDWYNTISPRGAGGIDITWPRCSSIFSESISCRELNSSKAKRQATQNHKHFTPTSKTHLICSIRPYRLVLMDDSFWCLTFWDKPLPSPLLSTVSLHLGRIETSEGFTSLSSQI